MNEMLFEYCFDTYGEDLTYLIERTFELYEDFGLPEYENSFFNIIMNHTYKDPSFLQDEFYDCVISYADEILNQHGIVLKPDVRLLYRVELLEGILILNDLVDYIEIYEILEQDKDTFELFSLVMETVTDLEFTDIMNILDDVNPMFISTLRDHVEKLAENDKNNEDGYDDLKFAIIKNARNFDKFMNKEPTAGIQMMDQGLLLAEDFSTYIPYIEEYLKIHDVKLLAITLYSVLILSRDGFKNPLMTFKDNLNKLPIDMNLHNDLDVALNNFSSEYEVYKRGTNAFN